MAKRLRRVAAGPRTIVANFLSVGEATREADGGREGVCGEGDSASGGCSNSRKKSGYNRLFSFRWWRVRLQEWGFIAKRKMTREFYLLISSSSL